jgi:hypothetical protein
MRTSECNCFQSTCMTIYQYALSCSDCFTFSPSRLVVFTSQWNNAGNSNQFPVYTSLTHILAPFRTRIGVWVCKIHVKITLICKCWQKLLLWTFSCHYRVGKFQHQKQANLSAITLTHTQELWINKTQQHEHVWRQIQIAGHLWWTVSFRLAEGKAEILHTEKKEWVE